MTIKQLSVKLKVTEREVRNAIMSLKDHGDVKKIENTKPVAYALISADNMALYPQTKTDAMESLLRKMIPKFYQHEIELDEELTETEKKVVEEYG